jgi:hypothetical protein
MRVAQREVNLLFLFMVPSNIFKKLLPYKLIVPILIIQKFIPFPSYYNSFCGVLTQGWAGQKKNYLFLWIETFFFSWRSQQRSAYQTSWVRIAF